MEPTDESRGRAKASAGGRAKPQQNASPSRRKRTARPELLRAADETLVAFLRLRIAEQNVSPALRDGRILRPPEAALYLGLSEKALWWHRRHESGPTYVRLGERNAVGYRVADLDSWLLSNAVAPRLERRPRSGTKGT